MAQKPVLRVEVGALEAVLLSLKVAVKPSKIKGVAKLGGATAPIYILHTTRRSLNGHVVKVKVYQFQKQGQQTEIPRINSFALLCAPRSSSSSKAR